MNVTIPLSSMEMETGTKTSMGNEVHDDNRLNKRTTTTRKEGQGTAPPPVAIPRKEGS